MTKKKQFHVPIPLFFDPTTYSLPTVVVSNLSYSTSHHWSFTLTRLLFPYVECPYLWIWSMTFFGGKELLRKAKKFSAAVTIVISFRILVLMLTLVIALLNTQGFRYEGVKGGLCLMKWSSETFDQAKTPFKMKVNSTLKIIKKTN